MRQGPDRVRYIDLGVSRGFEAMLRYEHLFERVVLPT